MSTGIGRTSRSFTIVKTAVFAPSPKARDNTTTIVTRMAGYMLANTVMSEVPVVGWAMDTLFRAQLMSANALQKDIEARHGRADEAVVDAPSWRTVAKPTF